MRSFLYKSAALGALAMAGFVSAATATTTSASSSSLLGSGCTAVISVTNLVQFGAGAFQVEVTPLGSGTEESFFCYDAPCNGAGPVYVDCPSAQAAAQSAVNSAAQTYHCPAPTIPPCEDDPPVADPIIQ